MTFNMQNKETKKHVHCELMYILNCWADLFPVIASWAVYSKHLALEEKRDGTPNE